MRKIKFRLIKAKKIVGYEYHLIDKDIDAGVCVYHQTKYDYVNKTTLSRRPITGGDKNFIFHDKKIQFTGLKDKNNKEIYEGDIVKIISITGTHYNSEVIFTNGSFYYENVSIIGRLESEKVEIIGNIYENPDILDSTKEGMK